MHHIYLQLAIIFILFCCSEGYSEGTDKLMPDSANNKNCRILVARGYVGGNYRDPFALYSNTDSNYRLYIHISDYTRERIYFGIGQATNGMSSPAGPVNWRIHRPDGTVEWSGTTPQMGPGFISYFSQAYAGPSKLNPAQGYIAKVCQPQVNGDYYMTFEVSNNQARSYKMIDITVIDTVSSPLVPKPGRVYSKSWQLNTDEGSDDHGFFGKMFVYSTDNVVTQFDPNGLRGMWFSFSCNESGCFPIDNNHNAQEARRSQYGLYNYPQYKVFLNNPDISAYPDGIIGHLVEGSVTTETHCNTGTVDFTFSSAPANAVGTVEVTLKLNTLIPPLTNRILVVNSVPGGSYMITWDGKDGAGVQVPSGSSFPFSLMYTNGLTHLPLWDVENNPDGFKVSLTRPVQTPSLPDPNFYWDDSLIGGSTVDQFPGCNSSTTVCHPWNGNFGDGKTINTWWYLVSNSTADVTITYKKGPSTLVPVNNPSQLCQGATATFSVSPDPNSSQYYWTWPGGNTTTSVPQVQITFPSNSPTGPTTVSVNGINTDCGSGPVTDITFTMLPIPALTTSLSFGTCSGVDYSIPLTSSVPGSTFSWTSPPPSCTPNITPPCPTGNTGSTITGNVTVIGILQGSVTYFVTPSANGCTGVTKDLVVNVAPLPDISTNPVSPSSVCSGQTTNIVLQSSFATTTFSWPAPVCSNILVPPPPGSGALIADPLQLASNTIPGSVIYSITPLNGSCAGVPVNHTVVVHPLPVPTITGSLNFDVCSGASETYTTESSMSNYSWSISPGGVINSGQGSNSINVTWNTVGSQTVQVTYTNADNCNPVTPTVQNVNVKPIPHLTNAAPSPICSAGNFSVTLVPDVTGGDFTWTATCNPVGSVTGFTAAQTTNVTQISDILTNTTFAIGTVTYLITPHANGCDGPPTPFSVDVNPKPDVLFTSPPLNPQEVCSGSSSVPVPLQSNVTLPVISYGWVAQAFDPVNPTTDISGFTTPNSGNTIPGENITSTLLNPGVIKYTVTATLSAGGAVCPGDPYQYQMIINPSPTVALNPSDPTGQTICSGASSQPITFTPNVTPTIYAWQAVEVVGVSGATASGTTDNIPAMTLTTTGAAQGHVRYQVTPTYQGGGSFQCPGGVSYSTIFVNPLPTPQFTVTSPVCEFGPPVQYQTASVSDHNYLWEITGADAISGETTPQVTVSWGAAGTGTLRVRETNSITGCIQHYPPIGQPPLQVVLQQRPVPSLTGPSSICEASSGNLYQTDAGTNHDYTWLIDGGIITAGGDGFPTATVTWTNPGTTNWIEVNYINALGCPGYPPHRDIIQVNPLPVATFTGTTTVCQLHPDAYLYPAESGPACSYSWSITPSSAGSIANPTVSPASITWNTNGNASLRLDAITSFGCTSFSSQPITINPRPDVSITPCFDLVTTRSAKRFLLKGGIPLLTATPLQGEYLINPATVALVFEAGNYYFDPSLVPGTNTVNFNLYYKYTSSQFGCPATSQNPVTITVFGANPACSSTMTDYRDNTTYRTSFVGGKCWMMENLRYGTPLTPTTTIQTDNCVAEKYCLSADPNCSAYGGFYQWDELIQYGVTASPEYQGVCPPGWHIPSAADFQALIDENQGNAMAGAILKDLNLSPRGFEALLDGMYYLNTAWAFTSAVPAGTMFWTSTPGSGNKIVTRGMNNMVPSVSLYETSRVNAFPVRCVKD